MIHICIGFYPNGDYVVNHVSDEHLESNVKYNSDLRPGRFYFVDGEHVCGGIMIEPARTQFIRECKNRIAQMNLQPATTESEKFY